MDESEKAVVVVVVRLDAARVAAGLDAASVAAAVPVREEVAVPAALAMATSASEQ